MKWHSGGDFFASLYPTLAMRTAMMKTAPSKPQTFDFVGKLAVSMARAHTLEELVRPLLEMLEAVTGLESTYLTTIDEAAGVQHVLFARNTQRLRIPEGISVPWESTLCKRALEEECSYTDDVALRWGDHDAARELGISTYASTAVRTHDGALYGTLCAASDRSKPIAEGAEQVLQMFSILIAQQIEREKLVLALLKANEILTINSLTDAITQLPNRRALMSEMGKRIASTALSDQALIVAFIDLDRFKAVNDQYGHDTGDRLLVAIGARIQGAVRSSDFVARLGGDEFVVLATVARSAAKAMAKRLGAKLQAVGTGQFHWDDQVVDCAGLSTGLIIAAPDARDAAALLAQADAAMYVAKRARRDTGILH